MSLNWSIEAIENHDELLVEAPPDQGGGKMLDPLTEAFIWASMVTGLGKNWTLDATFAPEFYARIKVYERLTSPLVYDVVEGERKPHLVTPEDVQRRIGLSVNVSPVTRASFLKNVLTPNLNDGLREYSKATEAPAAA